MDNKEELRKLINKLKLAITTQELEAHLAKLDAKQVELLILMCQEVIDYQAGIAYEAQLADPVEYEKLQKIYNDLTLKIREDSLAETNEIFSKTYKGLEEEEKLLEKSLQTSKDN